MAADPGATMNYLYYGDNLEVLRESIETESVDLVYLDPPFNSNRSYNVLFKNRTGEDAQAQIEAFDDTWTWNHEAEEQYIELVSGGAPAKVADAIEAMRRLLGENDVLAYLVMMTPRLVELHRVLKPTGSLYLHCDPTASHYLKIMLDAIFGPTHFRNEIIWRRTGSHGKLQRYGPIHDTILFVTKADEYTWNYPRKPYMRGHVEEYFVQEDDGRWRTDYYGNVLTGSGTRGGQSGEPWKGFDPTAKGRHWAIPGALVEDSGEDMSGMSQREKMDRLYELGYITIEEGAAWPIYQRYITPDDGTPAPDIWAYQPYTQGTVFGTEDGVDADVRWLNPQDAERLGYPTQKPVALLRRIIEASSSPGDVVLDPFAGCGTTIDAAQDLDREWIGIDITYISIDLVMKRLQDTHGEDVMDDVEVLGIPRDYSGAKALFSRSPFEFERWAVSLVNGQPNEKQVGDKGVDGVIRFPVDAKGKKIGRVLVSVKGGKSPGPTAVRDLAGTVEAQRAEMGVLVTLAPPTKGMSEAARHSGLYTWPWNGQNYPKVQIITVDELLAGERIDAPQSLLPYVEAKRQIKPMAENVAMF